MDFGDRRTGLAATDPDGRLALPLEILRIAERRALVAAIAAVAAERGSEMVLVGLPLAPDGGLGARGTLSAGFARELAAALRPLPVLCLDERGSTSAAHARLKQAGVRAAARKRKGVDAVAALLLLEAWMEGESAFPPPEP